MNQHHKVNHFLACLPKETMSTPVDNLNLSNTLPKSPKISTNACKVTNTVGYSNLKSILQFIDSNDSRLKNKNEDKVSEIATDILLSIHNGGDGSDIDIAAKELESKIDQLMIDLSKNGISNPKEFLKELVHNTKLTLPRPRDMKNDKTTETNKTKTKRKRTTNNS